MPGGALPGPFSIRPPHDLDELLFRARGLCGRTLAEIAAALGAPPPRPGARGKGDGGALLERALGATGQGAEPDFPRLRVELKTVPVDEAGRPRESTFVCAFSLAGADTAEWETSWVRAKLARVLFVPIVAATGAVRPPCLWLPTAGQEAVLHADFDELIGLIGVGGVERLTARQGRWLQVRPKARDGRARTLAYGPDGEELSANPRGFYLRRPFVEALLCDPTAEP